MNLLAEYKNGNLTTKLYSDGTRIRETEDDFFIPDFAENVDVHISNRCDNGCPMCYASCTRDGDFGRLKDWKFLDSLHAGTEMAINLNFPIHPNLRMFLRKLKANGVIVNATVNQNHFESHESVIKELIDEKLIYGLGISLVHATQSFVDRVKAYPNAIIHVINGIFNYSDYLVLQNNGLKILILGYKDKGRGTVYHADNKSIVEINKEWLYFTLREDFLDSFRVVCFDNLALAQLSVHSLLGEEEWDEFYCGDDGQFSFYLDLVKGTFSKNSLSEECFDIGDKSMDEMFKQVYSCR